MRTCKNCNHFLQDEPNTTKGKCQVGLPPWLMNLLTTAGTKPQRIVDESDTCDLWNLQYDW